MACVKMMVKSSLMIKERLEFLEAVKKYRWVCIAIFSLCMWCNFQSIKRSEASVCPNAFFQNH